ncbi:hypothetical protein Ccrd_026242 [Cynara cardunculus var. scolymus]|uniref:Uncharacterized protein n=1 Tax=Cynara cardunculus var. scolymus TaxID=59895 RepID=A0A103XDF9_CYNCS|nr:hypothetical protein Ccrd_026242 [Cynara cardunculus var. scolymus]
MAGAIGGKTGALMDWSVNTSYKSLKASDGTLTGGRWNPSRSKNSVCIWHYCCSIAVVLVINLATILLPPSLLPRLLVVSITSILERRCPIAYSYLSHGLDLLLAVYSRIIRISDL